MKGVLIGALMLGMCHVALADSTRDKYLSAVQKVAPETGSLFNSGKFKSFCVCTSGNVADVG